MKDLRKWVILGILGFLAGCGTKNLLSSMDSETTEDKARKALRAGEYAVAVENFTKLIAADPEAYQYYPLLASSHAGASGLDLLQVVKGQAAGGASGSVFDQIGKFLPSDPTSAQLASMASAIATLESMPSKHRTAGNDYDYAAGAQFQYTLFQACYAVMLMNQFTSTPIDPTKLASMTAADALLILNTLRGVVASAPDSTQGKALSSGVSGTLSDINAAEGSSDQEKLVSFLGG